MIDFAAQFWFRFPEIVMNKKELHQNIPSVSAVVIVLLRLWFKHIADISVILQKYVLLLIF